MNAPIQASFRPMADGRPIQSRVAATGNVRVELLECSTDVAVQWNIPRPDVSLIWVRGKTGDARITLSGRTPDTIVPGRASFWFFPEGVGAVGELTGKGRFDCAGVFIDPAFVPSTAKLALTTPIERFSHGPLGRAFDELAAELTEPDAVLPLFTEGWAMQALAYVARARCTADAQRNMPGSGLAPWQLRRAKEMFRADLAANLSLDRIAEACKLSVSHFSRAFKVSTGMPPHQWLIAARIEAARHLLVNSATSLVDVAGMCGFADQSHFSRVFVRVTGSSPGAWRRAYRA